jgi:hypothetical protein
MSTGVRSERWSAATPTSPRLFPAPRPAPARPRSEAPRRPSSPGELSRDEHHDLGQSAEEGGRVDGAVLVPGELGPPGLGGGEGVEGSLAPLDLERGGDGAVERAVGGLAGRYSSPHAARRSANSGERSTSTAAAAMPCLSALKRLRDSPISILDPMLRFKFRKFASICRWVAMVARLGSGPAQELRTRRLPLGSCPGGEANRVFFERA